MNPRQRRGLILMILAGIGAIAVFLTVVSYMTSLRAQYSETETVLVAKEDVNKYQQVDPSMFEEQKVPKQYASKGFVKDMNEGVSPGSVAVAATKLNKGSFLQKGMITAAPDLEGNEREVAIMVDAETGVAGKVQPGEKVDILATYEGESENSKPCAIRTLTGVEALEVGAVRAKGGEGADASSGQVPVTFRLSPEQELELTHAESFSSKLRLGRISPEGSTKAGKKEYCGGSNSSSDGGQ